MIPLSISEFLVVEGVFVHLSGAPALQSVSPVQTGGAFYHRHLFP